MTAIRSIAVFGASQSKPGDGHYEEAIRCGELIARAGFAVATGGYGGTMEAVSKGARAMGGDVIGVTAPEVFITRSGANEHVTLETPADSLIERIGYLVDETVASIALWGSLGTATELLVAWNLAFVAPFADRERKPVAAVGEPWLTLIPHLEETLDTPSGLVHVTATVESAVDHIVSMLV
ncbi:MAG: LOG family protein [Actinomycetia bacterium]|nr:LOG family protein [Actinomycetes bacterium]